MTVRECFEKAFGKMPDGASCHVHFQSGKFGGYPCPAIHWIGDDPDNPNSMNRYDYIDKLAFNNKWSGGWIDSDSERQSLSADISDRPADAFLGFFGDTYDRVVMEDGKPC